MPSHQHGKKITRSHTSAIEKTRDVLSVIERLLEVSKISLGIIKHIGVGKPTVKFHPITGGFKAVIRGNISIQEVWIYIKGEENIPKIQKLIKSIV